MKFVCERCNTRYSIADDKVRQKILKIRCKTCENVITVRDPVAPAAEPARVSAPQPQSPPAPPPSRGVTPPPLAGSREWFVAVNGDQAGPLTRAEAAKRVAEGQADDEIYLWKEGLDGWKPPEEIPAIQQELNALRARAAAAPPRVPAAPPASRPAAAPVGRGAAGARSAPAAASLATATSAFDDQDHTQIQPFDAGMLAPDFAARAAPAPAAAAVLPFKSGRQTNGAMAAVSAGPPVPASNSLDGLFSDFPSSPAAPAPGPAAFAPAPASLHASTRADSGLSKLTGFAGFMSRNPGLKFVAGGAVVVVLIALMVVVLVVSPNEQKVPPPAPVAVEKTEPPPAPTLTPPVATEPAKTAASVASVSGSKGPSMGAARTPKVVERKQARTSRSSINPPPPGGVEPPSIGSTEPPPPGAAARGTAPGERAVQAYRPNRTTPAPDQGGASGAPAQTAITSVVNRRDNQTTIKVCYDRALKRDDKIRSGKIVVTATIGMSGIVKGVSLNAPPEFVNLEPCIKQAIKRWAFPANTDEYQTEFTLIMQGNL